MESIFTARKRSLQRLYVFTGVCLSTWGGHVWWGACMCGRGSCVAGCMCDRRVCLAGGVSQGAYVAGSMNGGGACMAGGCARQERLPLQRAVRIILECILVKKYMHRNYYFLYLPCKIYFQC